jgi:rhodanese-related sulfurtransferase
MKETVGGATIDAKTLRKMLEKDEPVTVLDVRKAEDRAKWRIPRSVHFDTYDALKAKDPSAMAKAELPEGLPVVTVCGAGNSSRTAAEQLRARG